MVGTMVPQSLHITGPMLDYGFKSVIFFMLIFARLVGVFVQAPLFGRPRGIPMPVQVGYSLVISILLFHILPLPDDLPEGMMPFYFTLIGQVIVGLVIGFASYMVAAAAQLGGEYMDIQLGMSIAASIDPTGAGGQANLLKSFQFRLAILVWILIHGDYFFLRAVARSFELIPASRYALTGPAVGKLVEMSAGVFTIGLEIAAPVLVAMFIVDVALGLLNRASSQFNAFMISFPAKILVGVGVLSLSMAPYFASAMPNLYSNLNHDLIAVILALKGGGTHP